MPEPQTAPYGSWKSPITANLIVTQAIGLGQIAVDGEDIYWMELRPTEGGRTVVVRRTPDGRTTDVTPPNLNARTRVHEYGGGAYLVANGTIYFSNFVDQRLYRQTPGAEPRPISPQADMRYADCILDRRRGRIICVREDHAMAGREAVNTLVSLDLESSDGGQALVAGNDFYSSPRLSLDGSRLAWLTWNHPNMPWDGTELWVGEIKDDGSLGHAERVAGGVDESVFQPEWSPDGTLYFVSDRTGWWNLYRRREGHIESLCEKEAEFGLPQWVFGMSTYAFESAQRIICTYIERGTSRLAHLDTTTLELDLIETPYSWISSLCASPGRVFFIGGSPSEPLSIVRLDPSAGFPLPSVGDFAGQAPSALPAVAGQALATRQVDVLRRSSEMSIDPGYLSIPQAIEFPTEHGLTAHAFFYPPRNRDYAAQPGKQPPLLVMSHGGPTAATSPTFNLGIQFWTSRGIGVLDVNYGGSTGYGRAYRQRLNGRWGIVDVDDCVNGARYLVQRGKADGNRLAIRGGSAGGYTTLCALTFRDVFKAGASHFGVSDLETLAKDTHKFESRYLDSLIAPYPARRDLYVERSPIHFTHRLSAPMILFQGLEDQVVPPSQSQKMFEAMRAKELPVAYLAFEGEQHGFRRAENIQRALEAELYFYSKIFGFELTDPIEPVPIENL